MNLLTNCGRLVSGFSFMGFVIAVVPILDDGRGRVFQRFSLSLSLPLRNKPLYCWREKQTVNWLFWKLLRINFVFESGLINCCYIGQHMSQANGQFLRLFLQPHGTITILGVGNCALIPTHYHEVGWSWDWGSKISMISNKKREIARLICLIFGHQV